MSENLSPSPKLFQQVHTSFDERKHLRRNSSPRTRVAVVCPVLEVGRGGTVSKKARGAHRKPLAEVIL